MSPNAFDPDQSEPHLRERYGLDALAKSRRRARIILWPLGLLALGWLYWSANFAAHPAFRTELLGFKVVSSSEIEIDYQVQLRDPAKGGRCTLVARDENKNLLAQFSDPLIKGIATQHRQTHFKTTAMAVNGDLLGCQI
jgi:hypothetical protein